MNLIYKKSICAAIAIVLAVCCMTAPLMVSAQEPVKLSVSNVVGEPGKDVTVSINVSADSGLAAVDLIIKYDSTKLLYKEYKKIDKNSAAFGGFLSVNPNFKTAGTDAVKAAFIHAEGITAAGSLLDLVFTVAPGWTGLSTVTLEVTGDIVDATYKIIPFTVTNGAVSVGAAGENTATDETGEAVSSQNGIGDTALNSGPSAAAEKDSTEKLINQKSLIVFLSVCGVLISGAVVAFLIKKKK